VTLTFLSAEFNVPHGSYHFWTHLIEKPFLILFIAIAFPILFLSFLFLWRIVIPLYIIYWIVVWELPFVGLHHAWSVVWQTLATFK
jgi:hypothetical protein